MIAADLHVHSSCSVDSEITMASLCEAALAKGVTTIAFTEHKDFIAELGEYMDYFSYDRYQASVEECRGRFGDRLRILTAIEVDYTIQYEPQIIQYLDTHTFDYLIGSVHYLYGTEAVSEPRGEELFKARPKAEVIPRYFSELAACAKLGRFTSLGHLDMIKRYSIPFYGPFEPEQWMDLIRPILNALIETDTALGINTSGLRQDPGEMYPARPILKEYKQLGGSTVSVGSDAHIPEHVGYGFDQVAVLLEELELTLLSL